MWAGGVPTRELRRREEADSAWSIRVFAPEDSTLLGSSELLPPPIWEKSAEFISAAELESIVGEMERRVPRGGIDAPIRLDAEWGFGGPGLVRYNRVEGLSVGGRLQAASAVSTAELTVRVGTADPTPGAELRLTRELRRMGATLSGYHQLAAVDPSYLGLGNSLSAFFTGKDGGYYYRAAGARVTLAPSAEDRRSYELSLFAERHRPLERNTTWSVARLFGSDREMLPNIAADRGVLLGAGVLLQPWWGRSPSAPQGGVEYFGEAVTGDFRFVRSSVTLRAITPVASTYRLALETGAGTSWGELPVQSRWYLGGSRTLRGYDPGTAVGSSFLRGRAEVGRSVSAIGLALFGDVGWAGEADELDAARFLYSAGIGATLFDGIARFDVVRALSSPSGWSVELHLDALL